MLGLHLVPEEPFVGFQPPRQDYAWLVPPWVFLQPEETHRAPVGGFVTQVSHLLVLLPGEGRKEKGSSFPQLSGPNKSATWPWSQVSYIKALAACLPGRGEEGGEGGEGGDQERPY